MNMPADAQPVASPQPSQIIDEVATHEVPRAGGAGVVQEAPKPDKPLSAREAISKAIDDTAAAAKAKAEPDAKTEVKADAKPGEAKVEPAKAARAEDGKFARAADKVETQPVDPANRSAPEKAASERAATDDSRQSEGRKYGEPPARFLPEARTKWANVPNEVKAEIHRIEQETATELAKGKEASERYERIRQYDDIARSNGRDLSESLQKVVAVEQALARNPIAGLEMILREVGPRGPDGRPMSLYDVARHVASMQPQQFQQLMAGAVEPPEQRQQAPQNDAVSKELQQLRQELFTMKAEQTVVPMVTAFKASHPDFDAIENQITAILSSGVIDQIYGAGLSHEQKLAEAYRMAGGLGSPSHVDAPQPVANPAPVNSRLVDPDGKKSVTGAPSGGKTPAEKRAFKSNREALEAAFAAQGL